MTVNTQIDIHKLIDDAMEKKDRSVNLFISDRVTSIYVNPIREEDEPHWIDITPEPKKKEKIGKFEYTSYIQRICQCSNCGAETNWTTPYCSVCGEQMHGIRKEKTNEKVQVL